MGDIYNGKLVADGTVVGKIGFCVDVSNNLSGRY